MLQIAESRGIPVIIYRPGMISCHSQTGAANTDDMLCRLLKQFIQQGTAPDLDITTDMTPVDYMSQAIVHLSRQKESLGQIFHLVNPQSLQWSQLLALTRSQGYPIKQIAYTQWLSQLRDVPMGYQENALGALSTLFTEKIAGTELTYLDISSIRLQFDCQNTLLGLRDTTIVCPPADSKLLCTFFDYMKNRGFLDSPASV
ncbi:MAG: SDR family oxidoreductase [Rhizonema sp. NSF051]|nr:SDR family oxidoreductase [Rhizonema sp. NSF051]